MAAILDLFELLLTSRSAGCKYLWEKVGNPHAPLKLTKNYTTKGGASIFLAGCYFYFPVSTSKQIKYVRSKGCRKRKGVSS
jgi:hypothetical protein